MTEFFLPLMSKLHLLVVSALVCVVEDCFLHNKVPLMEDAPAEITKQNNVSKTKGKVR